MDVRPPASTNSTRKARGLPPHPALKRQPTIERRGKRIDPLTDDETLEEGGLTLPAKTIDEAEEVIMVAETPIQRAVLCEIMDGASEREIAAKLGVTRHRVRRILEILRLKAQRAA